MQFTKSTLEHYYNSTLVNHDLIKISIKDYVIVFWPLRSGKNGEDYHASDSYPSSGLEISVSKVSLKFSLSS